MHKDQVIVPGEVVRKRVYRAAPSFAADSPPYVADWAQVIAELAVDPEKQMMMWHTSTFKANSHEAHIDVGTKGRWL